MSMTNHSDFIVYAKKRLTKQQIEWLYNEGFQITGLMALADESFVIDLHAEYDLEKQSKHIQQVAKGLRNKNVHALNEELFKRWYKEEKEKVAILRDQLEEAQQQQARFTKTIQMLAKRIRRLRGVQE
jgi:tRNA(Phe) wybutosine-synthesizing methylase Tyw3